MRLVLLRHGESEANAADVFAGWLDSPLTARGIAEALAVGRELADLRPDVVHSSVLGRAIDTAHLVAEAAGWQLPLRRDWRLNERHYGALQGLGRELARRRYGAGRVEDWRRGVEGRPPCGESLRDVAERMAPYWHDVLVPELTAGRTVVVVSHGNAIRVLLHLATGLPLEQTAAAQVPTATPITPQVLIPAT